MYVRLYHKRNIHIYIHIHTRTGAEKKHINQAKQYISRGA